MLSDLSLSVDRLQEASPIVGGFLVGYVSALPLFGAASDARGRVPAALAALAVFAAGSLVTALAPSLAVLVAGRALQGLGGGALVPLALASVADLYPGRGREQALGLVTALQELGSVVGPAYGVLFALLLHGWRGVFLLNLPLALILGAGLWRGPRGVAPPPRSALDLPSALSLGAGLALVAAALYPDRPEVRALNGAWPPLLFMGVLLLAAYLWRQRRAVAWRPGLAGALVANVLVGGGLIVVLVDVPVFARAVLSVDQNRAGLLLTAFLAGVPFGAVAGGALAGRIGLRAPAAAGLALAALFFFFMSGWTSAELRAGLRAYAELAALGLGFGLAAAPLAASALNSTASSSQGFVSSLVVAARTMGMVVALSALTAYGLHRVNQLVAARGAPPAGLSIREQLKGLEHSAVAAFQVEFHEIFLAAAGFSLLAALVAALTLSGRRTAPPASPG